MQVPLVLPLEKTQVRPWPAQQTESPVRVQPLAPIARQAVGRGRRLCREGSMHIAGKFGGVPAGLRWHRLQGKGLLGLI